MTNPNDTSNLQSYDDSINTPSPNKTIKDDLNENLTFKDFFLRDSLSRSISDIQFHHPSEVQQKCIPNCILGNDLLCQSKSGSGKTAVFVISTLQLIEVPLSYTSVCVIVHSKEMAVQVKNEYLRFMSHYTPEEFGISNLNTDCKEIVSSMSTNSNISLKVEDFYGGVPVDSQVQKIKDRVPNIVIGTPGRILDLLNQNYLCFDKIKHFVIDEVDIVLSNLKMRNDVQNIIYKTPRNKQTLLFTATLNKEMKDTCLMFLRKDKLSICDIDEERKLRLRGITQYYVDIGSKMSESENDKNQLSNRNEDYNRNNKFNTYNQNTNLINDRQRRYNIDIIKFKTLEALIDQTDFSQTVIFVRDKYRAEKLSLSLNKVGFPASFLHQGMDTKMRLKIFEDFRKMKSRILVTTNLLSRGIDVSDVNLAINYDMPECCETYLHRIGRAGRFETEGMACTFVDSKDEMEMLDEVQKRFETEIKKMDI